MKIEIKSWLVSVLFSGDFTPLATQNTRPHSAASAAPNMPTFWRLSALMPHSLTRTARALSTELASE